jgi:hypothetical protein
MMCNPGKKRRNPSHRARRSAALKRAIKLRKHWYKLAKKTVKARTGLDSMPGLPDNYSPAHSRWMKQVKKVRRIAKYGTGLTNFIRESGRRKVVGNNPRWARPNENEIPTVRIVRKRNPATRARLIRERESLLAPVRAEQAENARLGVKHLSQGSRRILNRVWNLDDKIMRLTKGKRKNPSTRKRRSASKKRMLKKYEGINRRAFKSDWDSSTGRGKLARRLKHWTMAIRSGIRPGKLALARERSVRGLRVRNPLYIGDSAMASIHGAVGVNPSKKRRKGRCGATPGAAAARLAKWRWHHNPKRGRK